MHFQKMTYMVTPPHKNHCPGDEEICNFGMPFLSPYNYKLFFNPCPGAEKKILKCTFYPQINSSREDWWS